MYLSRTIVNLYYYLLFAFLLHLFLVIFTEISSKVIFSFCFCFWGCQKLSQSNCLHYLPLAVGMGRYYELLFVCFSFCVDICIFIVAVIVCFVDCRPVSFYSSTLIKKKKKQKGKGREEVKKKKEGKIRLISSLTCSTLQSSNQQDARYTGRRIDNTVNTHL